MMTANEARGSGDNIDVLIHESRQGSEKAFTELVRLHQGRVRSYLHRLLFNRPDDLVDDLAQETFLAAYRSLQTFKGDAPLDLWLLRVAKNRALTLLRDEDRRRNREQSADCVVAGLVVARLEGNPDHESKHHPRLAALRACLKTLPEHSGQMVREFYFRGRGAGDIARSTGRTEGAIWVALLRFRRALRHCVDGRLKTGEVTL